MDGTKRKAPYRGPDTLDCPAMEDMTLRIVACPDPRARGVDIDLSPGSTRFGRADGPPRRFSKTRGWIRLGDDTISTEHALLRCREDAAILEDRDSTNGTWVGGRRIERVELKDGDVVRVGDTVLLLCRRATAEPGRGPAAKLVGVSAGMCEVRALIRRGAGSGLNVLITGESGTGKELAARGLHDLSGRSGPYVPIHVAALPGQMVSSELFGYARGAFTGAVNDHPGAFIQSDGGTLFLDEIGEIPVEVQPILLRAIESREIRQLGKKTSSSVDLRVVAATLVDLDSARREGEFREDLYQRLNQFPIRLPPLRERREDVPVLWRHFLGDAPASRAVDDPDVLEALLVYPWPGNVRELKNIADQIAALGEESPGVDRLPAEITAYLKRIRRGGPADLGTPGTTKKTPEERAPLGRGRRPSREELLEAIRRHGGNLAQVAREFGRERMQVYRWRDQYGIDPEEIERERGT